MPVRYEVKGGVFVPTDLPTDFVRVVHDAAANTFKPTSLYWPDTDLPFVRFAFDHSLSGLEAFLSNGGEINQIIKIQFADKILNFRDQDPIAGTSKQIFWRPDGSSGYMGRFVANLGTTQLYVEFNDGSGERILIWNDTSADQDSWPVHVNEGVGSGYRLLVPLNAQIPAVFVRSEYQRYVVLAVDQNAVFHPALYYDTAEADKKMSLKFVSPTNSNTTNTSQTHSGWRLNDYVSFEKFYLNENAPQEDRFQADLSFIGGIDIHVYLVNRVFKIKHNANAFVDGVPVFFDDMNAVLRANIPSTNDCDVYYVNDRRPYGFLTNGVIV